jgi:uncharacterized membrane protein
VWDPATGLATSLPVPRDDDGRIVGSPAAAGVNRKGDVVGWVELAGVDGDIMTQPHAVWWDAASHALHRFAEAPYTASFAYGINDDGTAVGEVVDTTSRERRGAVWSTAGPARTTLPVGTHLLAVNAGGLAVGHRDDTFARVPIRWTAAGGVTDLATPPEGTSLTVTAVNDAGTAVGTRQSGGHTMAVRFS